MYVNRDMLAAAENDDAAAAANATLTASEPVSVASGIGHAQ